MATTETGRLHRIERREVISSISLEVATILAATCLLHLRRDRKCCGRALLAWYRGHLYRVGVRRSRTRFSAFTCLRCSKTSTYLEAWIAERCSRRRWCRRSFPHKQRGTPIPDMGGGVGGPDTPGQPMPTLRFPRWRPSREGGHQPGVRAQLQDESIRDLPSPRMAPRRTRASVPISCLSPSIRHLAFRA